jgi:hypothetical protein
MQWTCSEPECQAAQVHSPQSKTPARRTLRLAGHSAESPWRCEAGVKSPRPDHIRREPAPAARRGLGSAGLDAHGRSIACDDCDRASPTALCSSDSIGHNISFTIAFPRHDNMKGERVLSFSSLAGRLGVSLYRSACFSSTPSETRNRPDVILFRRGKHRTARQGSVPSLRCTQSASHASQGSRSCSQLPRSLPVTGSRASAPARS